MPLAPVHPTHVSRPPSLNLACKASAIRLLRCISYAAPPERAAHLQLDALQLDGVANNIERNNRPHSVASYILLLVTLHVQTGGG